jgi:hypothetical protein
MNTVILLLAVAQVDSPIKTDEVVTFFPTAGAIERNEAVLPIHGWIFEAEADSILRRQTLELFRKAMELEADATETAIFKARAAFFLVDNERGKAVPIRIGDRVFVMPESEADGHFRGTIRLPLDDIKRLQTADGGLPFQVVMRPGDARRFAGRVQVIGETGFSVITDIDDTIKVSEVRSKASLLANTFLREFQPVAGMAEAFQKWQGRGAAFHYVSASPWQLFPPLAEFQEKHHFPHGSWHLKDFRWKDSSFWNLFSDPERYKPGVIEPLLKAYPRRKFLCVGDSGEKDPEIYAALVRRHPGRIVRILIRDVTGESADSERYRQAFAGLPAESWQIFKEPKELRPVAGLDGP